MLLRNIARLRDGLPVHFAKAIDRAVILQPNPSPKLRRWVTSGSESDFAVAPRTLMRSFTISRSAGAASSLNPARDRIRSLSATTGPQDRRRRVDHDAARWAHRATASEWQRPLRDES